MCIRDRLTEGSINPADILAVNGPKAVQNYIITEVQTVYRLQGVDTVSYTHLDVYKRQVDVCCTDNARLVRRPEVAPTDLLPKFCPIYIQFSSCVRGATLGIMPLVAYTQNTAMHTHALTQVLYSPVSYTHLDVYKRQWHRLQNIKIFR